MTLRPLVSIAAVAMLGLLGTVGCATAPKLPPKANELNHQGAAALAAGDLMAAEARFNLALDYSPRFTEAWVNLGLLELRRGNLDLAYQDEAPRARSQPESRRSSSRSRAHLRPPRAR